MSVGDVLAKLVPELQTEAGVVAIFLTGSVNRGEADEFSDLDVSVLVRTVEFVHNSVCYRDGFLVSVERSTPEHRAQAFTDPVTALWNLFSLQTGRALYDPEGIFAELQVCARAVDRAALRRAGEAQACAQIANQAEELHKVMGGLSRGDEAKIIYALAGLTFSLGTAALLSTGKLLPTENRYLTLARDAWDDPEWREAYSCLVGLTGASPRRRGLAALRAYVRAVTLLRWAEGTEQALAYGAAQRAQSFLTNKT